MKHLRRILTAAAAAAFAVIAAASFVAPANSAQPEINTLDSDGGYAIKGYDTVAYFTESKPRKGKPEFTVEYKGAKWLFASAENKALFEADPAKYAPVYGGFCAYGVSRNYLVKIEPDAWAIRDGKLYLNYDKSVQKTWAASPVKYINQADKNWPGLIAKK
ncbi:MAG: YHS domain-containing protein [Rhodomicrobium sp.]|nr:YHS domain-containing protein [Rhodomicrobium sp.]